MQSLKDGLSSDTVLAYFDPHAHHEVHVDGSPIGESGTLVQQRSKEKRQQVVQYASRVPKRNIPRENWRYWRWILGVRNFICISLEIRLPFCQTTNLWKLYLIILARHKTSLRLQRILVRMMMDYDFTVKYQPGKGNISDYTSRHPVQSQRGNEKEGSYSDAVQQQINFIMKNDIRSAITI